MNENQSLQEVLFNVILTRFPRKADAVDLLCHLLNTTKDPIYRRLRGDTALTPDEISILVRHFQLSFDALIYGQSDQVVFAFNPFRRQLYSFESYIGQIHDDLGQLRRLPDAHIYYATAEIPIFTYMHFPELMAFKLYVWGRTTWSLPFVQNRKFDMSLWSPPVERLCDEVLKIYLTLPSTELWSLNVVDNTLMQIENLAYSGNYTDPQASLHLCDIMTEWVRHLKIQATAGKKMRVGADPATEGQAIFTVHHNEILHTNNTILVKTPSVRAVYSAFCNPNFMKTMDEKACDYMENWFKIVLDSADPITAGSRDRRDRFFNQMQARVDAVKRRIGRFLEENADE